MKSFIIAILLAAVSAVEYTVMKKAELAQKYGVSLRAVDEAIMEYNQINLAVVANGTQSQQ